MKLTTKQRQALPDSDFLLPRGSNANPGKRMFPVEDLAHARDALGRIGQKRTRLTRAERAFARAEDLERWPEIDSGRRRSSRSALPDPAGFVTGRKRRR